LSDDAAQPHDEKRDLQSEYSHVLIHYQYIQSL